MPAWWQCREIAGCDDVHGHAEGWVKVKVPVQLRERVQNHFDSTTVDERFRSRQGQISIFEAREPIQRSFPAGKSRSDPHYDSILINSTSKTSIPWGAPRCPP